jgi:hypothetical protein
MSDLQFGGRITLEFADTKLVQTEADFVIDPGYFEKSSKANHDGSAAYMLKPKLAGCDIKPRDDSGIDWNALLLKSGNATIVEETTGRTHFFTGCQLVGTAKSNLSSGEVDGLRIEGGAYRKLAG